MGDSRGLLQLLFSHDPCDRVPAKNLIASHQAVDHIRIGIGKLRHVCWIVGLKIQRSRLWRICHAAVRVPSG